jgi:hypothetical protein
MYADHVRTRITRMLRIITDTFLWWDFTGGWGVDYHRSMDADFTDSADHRGYECMVGFYWRMEFAGGSFQYLVHFSPRFPISHDLPILFQFPDTVAHRGLF